MKTERIIECFILGGLGIVLAGILTLILVHSGLVQKVVEAIV